MLRRCKTFRCKNLHNNKNGYCDECTRKKAKTFSDADTRASASARGYNSKWREFSKAFLRDHPRCAVCGAPAQVTDHKDTPAEIMLDLYGRFDLDPAHYQPLCVACNTRKAADDRRKVEEYFKKKQTRGEGQNVSAGEKTGSVQLPFTHDGFSGGRIV